MGRTHNINVEPCGEGWAVKCDQVSEPVVFLAGGRAEQHARALAIALAQTGHDVRVFVKDRNHRVVGTGRYFGAEPEGLWLSLAEPPPADAHQFG